MFSQEQLDKAVESLLKAINFAKKNVRYELQSIYK